LPNARFTEHNQEQLWTLAGTTFPTVLHIAQTCMQHQTDEAGVAVKLALKIFLATTSVRTRGRGRLPACPNRSHVVVPGGLALARA